MKKLTPGALLSLTLLSFNVSALEVVGTLPYKFTVTKNLQAVEKKITLMKLQFTPEEENALLNYRPEKDKTSALKAYNALPSSVNLGMNSAPVLDQGMHGTCVTFATSGALDALIDKKDYVSQLCSLELGTYLHGQKKLPYSGWDGSWGSLVLSTLSDYGIVNMSKQLAGKCAGVTQYPTHDPSTGHSFPADQYMAISESIDNISWKEMLNLNQRLGHDAAYVYDGEASLNKVKTMLASYKKSGVGAGRVTYGTTIILNDRLLKKCSVGACGTYHKTNDTWAFTREVKQAANAQDTEKAGHEMVIIGYDDNAKFKDRNGDLQKGLLILRNSWGPFAGDSGTYYMTYDYFKRYVLETYAIKRNS